MLKKISQDDLAERKQDHGCEQDNEKISFDFFKVPVNCFQYMQFGSSVELGRRESAYYNLFYAAIAAS